MDTLPSDAETCVSLDPSLPDEVNTSSFSDSDVVMEVEQWRPGVTCCRLSCLREVDNEAVSSLHSCLGRLSKGAADEYICDALRLLIKSGAGKLQWVFQGHSVCLRAWRHIFQLGGPRIQRLKEHVLAGHPGAPVDLRRTRQPSEVSWQRKDADAFFLPCYQNPAMAETLAEDVIVGDGVDALDITFQELGAAEFKRGKVEPVVRDGFSEWLLSPLSAVGVANVDAGKEIRYMSPITLHEWWEEYTQETASDLHCSLPVFLRVYNESWKHCLKIRRISVHAVCHECATWREYRKLARLPDDMQSIREGHQKHIRDVFADRAIEERLEVLGETSTQSGQEISESASILDMVGDGADQAKFRLPRNFEMTKVWDGAWRPTLHVVGNLISGALEAFYVTDLDVVKDSNLACTCFARSLELVVGILKNVVVTCLGMRGSIRTTHLEKGRTSQYSFWGLTWCGKTHSCPWRAHSSLLATRTTDRTKGLESHAQALGAASALRIQMMLLVACRGQ